MIKIDSLKKELICISLATLFINLYLVYKEPRESLSLILAFYFIFKILSKEKNTSLNPEKKKRVLTKVTTLAITYIVVQILLLSNIPKIDLNIEESYTNKENKAVLVVYQGEEEHYNLKKQVKNIRKHGSVLEKINTSFMLNKHKKSYYEIGKSNYGKKTHTVKNKLQNIMIKEKYKIYLGFLEGEPYIEESIKEIVNTGYSEVLVVPVFIKQDKYYESVIKTIDEMRLFNGEITVKYLDDFGEGEELVNSYMKKINDEIGEENIRNTGVILIGSGENPTEKEVLFRNKIAKYLHKISKLEENKIKKAWFKDDSPDYIWEVKSLLELGVSDIIIIYTEPGVTNMDNNEIYNKITKKINFPEGIKTKLIDGFLIEDELIEEIKKRIEILELVKQNTVDNKNI